MSMWATVLRILGISVIFVIIAIIVTLIKISKHKKNQSDVGLDLFSEDSEGENNNNG